jgi:hypothetical protein
MGCNSSKVPLAVVDTSDGNNDNCRRPSMYRRSVSALDFTTSTEFFRRSSTLLLWKTPDSSSPKSVKKKTVFEIFKEQAHQEDLKQEKEQEALEKTKFMTSLSSSAVRCHYEGDEGDEVVPELDLVPPLDLVLPLDLVPPLD